MQNELTLRSRKSTNTIEKKSVSLNLSDPKMIEIWNYAKSKVVHGLTEWIRLQRIDKIFILVSEKSLKSDFENMVKNLEERGHFCDLEVVEGFEQGHECKSLHFFKQIADQYDGKEISILIKENGSNILEISKERFQEIIAKDNFYYNGDVIRRNVQSFDDYILSDTHYFLTSPSFQTAKWFIETVVSDLLEFWPLYSNLERRGLFYILSLLRSEENLKFLKDYLTQTIQFSSNELFKNQMIPLDEMVSTL